MEKSVEKQPQKSKEILNKLKTEQPKKNRLDATPGKKQRHTKENRFIYRGGRRNEYRFFSTGLTTEKTVKWNEVELASSIP
jgi:hypothetical protein